MSARLLVLLRGVNVGGHNKLPMADLRQLALALGYRDPKTYIQSGNLLITTDQTQDQVETTLEEAIHSKFNYKINTLARTPEQLRAYTASCPFPEAAQQRPSLLHLGLAKRPLGPQTEERLQKYVHENERIHVTPDAIWIDYGNGVGRSKLSPKVIQRATSCPVTARNWRTLHKLQDLLQTWTERC